METRKPWEITRYVQRRSHKILRRDNRQMSSHHKYKEGQKQVVQIEASLGRIQYEQNSENVLWTLQPARDPEKRLYWSNEHSSERKRHFAVLIHR